jgi:hypothetical protein
LVRPNHYNNTSTIRASKQKGTNLSFDVVTIHYCFSWKLILIAIAALDTIYPHNEIRLLTRKSDAGAIATPKRKANATQSTPNIATHGKKSQKSLTSKLKPDKPNPKRPKTTNTQMQLTVQNDTLQALSSIANMENTTPDDLAEFHKVIKSWEKRNVFPATNSINQQLLRTFIANARNIEDANVVILVRNQFHAIVRLLEKLHNNITKSVNLLETVRLQCVRIIQTQTLDQSDSGSEFDDSDGDCDQMLRPVRREMRKLLDNDVKVRSTLTDIRENRRDTVKYRTELDKEERTLTEQQKRIDELTTKINFEQSTQRDLETELAKQGEILASRETKLERQKVSLNELELQLESQHRKQIERQSLFTRRESALGDGSFREDANTIISDEYKQALNVFHNQYISDARAKLSGQQLPPTPQFNDRQSYHHDEHQLNMRTNSTCTPTQQHNTLTKQSHQHQPPTFPERFTRGDEEYATFMQWQSQQLNTTSNNRIDVDVQAQYMESQGGARNSYPTDMQSQGPVITRIPIRPEIQSQRDARNSNNINEDFEAFRRWKSQTKREEPLYDAYAAYSGRFSQP